MSGSGDIPGSEELGNSTEPPTTCNNPFDDRIYAIVAAVAATSAFISFLASGFVILIIILFKKWRFYTQRLILYLAITAALLSLAYLLQRTDYENQSVHYSNFCIFAGFLSQVTSWMVLNAIVCIMTSLLLTAFFNKRAEKYEILFLFLIFVFPLTFNWIPFIKSTYGKAGAWCWIRSKDDTTCQKFEFGQVLQLVLWYIPLYVVMFVLIVLYVIVLVKLHRTKRMWTGNIDPYAKKIQEQISKEILPLLAYPLVFILLSIPPFINRIHSAADPQNPEPVLWVISAALFPLQGGVIAIAFSLDPETRKRLTLANFKAAFSNFRRTKAVQEYNIPGNEELEKSPTRATLDKSVAKGEMEREL